MSKNKNDGKYRIFNESKTTYIDCIPETNPFDQNECCIQLIIEKIYKI